MLRLRRYFSAILDKIFTKEEKVELLEQNDFIIIDHAEERVIKKNKIHEEEII